MGLLALPLLACVASSPLDDYVNQPEPAFGWFDTGVRVKLPFGATAHILNVTSQQWLTEKEAIGPNGALWTHQVAVVVPKNVTSTAAVSLLTGGCNEGPPKPPAATDEFMLTGDVVAARTGSVAIVVYQLPNCERFDARMPPCTPSPPDTLPNPNQSFSANCLSTGKIVFPSDPQRMPREEDELLAWAWRQFLTAPAASRDPRWLPRLPMVKAAMQCMKAVEQYTAKSKIVASVDGWFVGGASKRGWTTWMVGAVDCPTCVNILGIFPLVPIVPRLRESVHLQRQSLGGFTFAFRDYFDAGILPLMDTDAFGQLLDIVDPSSPRYAERLKRLPKLAVVSSDDEFMQFDWTAIKPGWDQLPGETHLLIAPNSEHTLATGIPDVISSVTHLFASIQAKEGPAARPSFTWSKDAASGALSVTLDAASPRPSKVLLRHAQTKSERRDFRWVRLADNSTKPCSVLQGEIPLTSPVEGGGNCLVPMFWHSETLKPTVSANDDPHAPLTYTAQPPQPTKTGHFVGYFIELFFPSQHLRFSDMKVTTPGHVWPDHLPFPDCNTTKCPVKLL